MAARWALQWHWAKIRATRAAIFYARNPGNNEVSWKFAEKSGEFSALAFCVRECERCFFASLLDVIVSAFYDWVHSRKALGRRGLFCTHSRLLFAPHWREVRGPQIKTEIDDKAAVSLFVLIYPREPNMFFAERVGSHGLFRANWMCHDEL